MRDHGRLDVLVNNAGGAIAASPLKDNTLAEWETTLRLNLTSQFLMIRSVIPIMEGQGGGRIINIATNSAFNGVTAALRRDGPPMNYVAYVAAKGGVVGLTRALARELGPSNITVNAVAPGFTPTERVRKVFPEKAMARMVDDQALARLQANRRRHRRRRLPCVPGRAVHHWSGYSRRWRREHGLMGLLDGKTVLITGAGSNVGRAAAALFHREGASLALSDLDPARIVVPDGAQCISIKADLTRASECDAMVERTVGAFGGIDALCNTAGIDPPAATTVSDTSEADWDRVMAVNLKGVFLACRAALRIMSERGGAIANVASQGALLTFPRMAAYGVSKAAVLQLTRQIAVDYAAQHVRANCVCPSGLETPSLDRLAILEPHQLERRHDVMTRAAPLGRVCTPEDVAHALLFLISDLSGFTTGAALPVEGGASIALRF